MTFHMTKHITWYKIGRQVSDYPFQSVTQFYPEEENKQSHISGLTFL